MEWPEILQAVIVWGSVIFIVYEIVMTLHTFRLMCEAIEYWVWAQLPEQIDEGDDCELN